MEKSIVNWISVATLGIIGAVRKGLGIAHYYKSAAAFKIAKQLGELSSFATVSKILPLSLRDTIYDFIAKTRYEWYGRQENYMIPTPKLQSKFLFYNF